MAKFKIVLGGNGKNIDVAIDFSTAPVVLEDGMSSDFSFSETPLQGILPSSLTTDGVPVKSVTVAGGVATFTFVKAPPESVFTVSGYATVTVPD